MFKINKNTLNKLKEFFSDLLRRQFNIKKSDIRYAKIYLASILSFIILLVILGNFTIGYAVNINNKNMGCVKEKNATDNLISQLNDELNEYFTDEENKVNLKATYRPVIAPNFSFAESPDEIVNNIKDTVDFYTEACAIYVDNTFVFSMKDITSAKETVKAFADMYTPSGEDIEVKFLNTVTYKDEKTLYTRILEFDDAIGVLKGFKDSDQLYTVVEGDTLWEIGIKNDIVIEDLMELNSLDSENIYVGQKLRIANVDPLIKVNVARTVTYTEYQPFETEYIYDSTLSKGTNKIIQNGSKGEKTVCARIITINNHETEREILSETVVSEPVKNIIKVGTKPKPKTAATGYFLRPISGGYVSSAFGNRSRGYHTGIDYAVSYGSPIYASDGGTVTSSGWGGGYGYMIKINHGNGYETVYAHCSRLLVKYGAKVQKGQVIAYVGSTGNSTGPHLHFEIRKNGTCYNPAKYV